MNNTTQNNTSNRPDISPDVDTITKLIICIDSNRKYLDHRLFWKPDGTKWIPTGEIENVNRDYNGKKYSNLQAVLISCGVKDIDTKTGSLEA